MQSEAASIWWPLVVKSIVVNYSAVKNARAQNGDSEVAEQGFEQAVTAGVMPSMDSYSGLIKGCA